MYSDLDKKYIKYFKNKPEVIVKAPGRINLIGEHTDYHKGFVLPAAIDRYMLFAMGRNDSGDQIRIVALDMNEDVRINLDVQEDSEKSWVNYFVGIIGQLRERGHKLSGLDIVFGGNIPVGGGLSSSSALECGFLKGINHLFDIGLNHLEMIEISRESNHQFLGLQGGIMDQYSILFGNKDHAMLLDCSKNEHVYIPVDLDGYTLLLIDSKVSHELVSSGYNDRVTEGESALKKINKYFPNVPYLSAARLEMLAKVKSDLTHSEFKRVQHVIDENQRVHAFCTSLTNRDYKALGKHLYDSHESLRFLYEVSCEETDLLVELAKRNECIIGARMMGGGFGGCILNLVCKGHEKEASDELLKEYKNETQITGEVYIVNIVEGVSVLPVI